MRAVYIDEIEDGAGLGEAEESVVAGRFQEMEFVGVGAEYDVGFESAL